MTCKGGPPWPPLSAINVLNHSDGRLAAHSEQTSVQIRQMRAIRGL